MPKIAIAMSGGVDSSVAAALAVDKYGKENVFGVTMKLFCYGDNDATEKSCCSIDAINDAAAVCKQLGVPHYVVNLEKEFEAEIIDNFVAEYSQAKTPNPCVRCNSLIKFKHLLARARELGAETLVTGHYARVNHDKDGYHLLTGLDKVKDQSYFLYNLDQDQLAHIWFPLGDLTKPETRKLAEKYALKTAQKTESQDICFVPTTTKDFLTDKVVLKPGDIVDHEGRLLGKHEGLPLYTIGQRKGLGGGFSEPMFVTGLDLVLNRLVVGREEALYSDTMIVKDVTWTNGTLRKTTDLDVKIRYNSVVATATLKVGNDEVIVQFNQPQKAVTPGQTAVFYKGEEVVGGGIIQVSEVPVPS